jgi:hypothetical protein
MPQKCLEAKRRPDAKDDGRGENEEPFSECVSKRMTVTNNASEKDEKYDIEEK